MLGGRRVLQSPEAGFGDVSESKRANVPLTTQLPGNARSAARQAVRRLREVQDFVGIDGLAAIDSTLDAIHGGSIADDLAPDGSQLSYWIDYLSVGRLYGCEQQSRSGKRNKDAFHRDALCAVNAQFAAENHETSMRLLKAVGA